MPDPVSIDPKPDGPLQVSGGASLSNSRGEAIPVEAQFWLCRCGASSNKPFCDGSHKKVGFSSARLSDPAKRATKDYAGKNITIHDNRSVCAHAGYCVSGSPAVFSMTTKPWINADGDAVEKTMATIQACPSGALSYSLNGVLQEPVGRAPSVRIVKDGPYAVIGGPELKGDAAPVSKEHYTLCRCGASKNKPFCDGSHSAVGFKDEKN